MEWELNFDLEVLPPCCGRPRRKGDFLDRAGVFFIRIVSGVFIITTLYLWACAPSFPLGTASFTLEYTSAVGVLSWLPTGLHGPDESVGRAGKDDETCVSTRTWRRIMKRDEEKENDMGEYTKTKTLNNYPT